MGTAPPKMLSWRSQAISPVYSNSEKCHTPTSARHPHLKMSIHLGLAVQRAHSANWCVSQSCSRRFQDQTVEVSKQSSPLGLGTSGLSRILKIRTPLLVPAHLKLHHPSYVCCAADNGAFFSTAYAGDNGAYDINGGLLLYSAATFQNINL